MSVTVLREGSPSCVFQFSKFMLAAQTLGIHISWPFPNGGNAFPLVVQLSLGPGWCISQPWQALCVFMLKD